jgi:hypothetical protein
MPRRVLAIAMASIYGSSYGRLSPAEDETKEAGLWWNAFYTGGGRRRHRRRAVAGGGPVKWRFASGLFYWDGDGKDSY